MKAFDRQFRTALFLTALVCGLTSPAAAQASGSGSSLSFRPFFVVSGEQFAAAKTFDAVFGTHGPSPFWGGGVRVDVGEDFFVEVAASRFSKTGQRAFVSNGTPFPLGIPLTVKITPFEVSGGARFKLAPRVTPYAGAGVGRYAYSETSDFSNGDDVSTSHLGFVVFGGAEFRVHPWVAIAADAQLTRVGGGLGDGGVSKEFGEDNLGGTAVRVKVLVGK